MRFTAVIGSEVWTAQGERLGHILDLRCAREGAGTGQEYAVVSGIVFGRIGWLERLGFLAVREEIAAWKDIETFGRAKIVLSARFVPGSPRNR